MDHPIVITFLIFAVIGFMALAADVLKPLALAILISFALAPLARLIERSGVPRPIAVLVTVMLILGVAVGIGYKVGEQITELAPSVEKYRDNLHQKIHAFQPGRDGALSKISHVGDELSKINVSAEVSRIFDQPTRTDTAVPVKIVSGPSILQRIQTLVGPYLEMLGVGGFVFILVMFLLINRDDVSDRIVRLFGLQRVSLTTKSMDEIGQRISKYLLTFALVNSGVGLVAGLGLWAIGVELAMLWGVLAAFLRFIPYIGPALAFLMPLLFSVACFPGWHEPLLVIALFASIELLANTVLEPVIYGRTTGITALGLLIAAMFWTWLWGSMGLLLSTPMTVCLAVLGKYVPELSFFAVLLGEDSPLEPDMRFYQRLLAKDPEGAVQAIPAAKENLADDVFDKILVPTLSRTERDHRREVIDDEDRAAVLQTIEDLLDDLEESNDLELKTLADPGEFSFPETGPVPSTVARVVGIVANGSADALVLRMLAITLAPTNCSLIVLNDSGTPLKLADQILELKPEIVVLSHIPPGGSKRARYLLWRLHAQVPDLPIIVGRWGPTADPAARLKRLTALGASSVVTRVAEARDVVLERLAPKPLDSGIVPAERIATSASALP
jgi:predicted PurR-regulated permease PerM